MESYFKKQTRAIFIKHLLNSKHLFCYLIHKLICYFFNAHSNPQKEEMKQSPFHKRETETLSVKAQDLESADLGMGPSSKVSPL